MLTIYQKLSENVVTVTNTAQTIKQLVVAAGGTWSTIHDQCNMVHFQVTTNAIRVCPDGNTPTNGTRGLHYTVMAEVQTFIGDISKIKFIREGASDATMQIFIGEISR